MLFSESQFARTYRRSACSRHYAQYYFLHPRLHLFHLYLSPLLHPPTLHRTIFIPLVPTLSLFPLNPSQSLRITLFEQVPSFWSSNTPLVRKQKKKKKPLVKKKTLFFGLGDLERYFSFALFDFLFDFIYLLFPNFGTKHCQTNPHLKLLHLLQAPLFYFFFSFSFLDASCLPDLSVWPSLCLLAGRPLSWLLVPGCQALYLPHTKLLSISPFSV
ncbi:hypothetical protein L873DRAFT_586535 [Choiromyces venosus 120613-1]|uniref:Uncharacterized protein n=1 Tax=Choiromyces venosus 120613-1 TaxID=1336337 RepID=A0A3N4J052_9PEZI|nr:hypothetical protein L873DRAFT_586535 [Choiromyces venosus 120613-1]